MYAYRPSSDATGPTSLFGVEQSAKILSQNSKVFSSYFPDSFKKPHPGNIKDGLPSLFGIMCVTFDDPNTSGIPEFCARSLLLFTR